jgi:DNA repair photolyase
MPSARKLESSAFRWRLAADDDAGRLFPEEELVHRHVGVGEYRGLEFLQVNARRVLNEVARAPFGFRWTVNAYRGCSHACTYCFARPTHAYLGFDIAGDFDSKIVVKVNAIERLRAELRHPRWSGELVAMGTNTDPYQRAEGRYRLTQGLVGVLAEASNPFSILTKSPLILRDLQLLAEAAARTEVRASFSVGTLDPEVWRLTEPGAPHPERRLEAVGQLNAAGVPCSVLMGPVLPELSDGPDQLAAVVERAVAAGATSISAVYLHLRGPLRDHVLSWAKRERPALAERWERLYAGRANLPSAMQRQLSERVAALVSEARQRLEPSPSRAAPPGDGGGVSRPPPLMGVGAGRSPPLPGVDGGRAAITPVLRSRSRSSSPIRSPSPSRSLSRSPSASRSPSQSGAGSGSPSPFLAPSPRQLALPLADPAG